jgi:hypothetical protein
MDTGDEKQVKEKKAVHQLEREKEVAELHAILQTYGGRAFIWRMMTEAKIHEFGYCGDNNMLNNMEGRRRIGAWVLAEVMDADSKAYTLMWSEAENRDQGPRGPQMRGKQDG